jgi:hypothetical protein
MPGAVAYSFYGLGELSTGANKTQLNFVNRRFADEPDRKQPAHVANGP